MILRGSYNEKTELYVLWSQVDKKLKRNDNSLSEL